MVQGQSLGWMIGQSKTCTTHTSATGVDCARGGHGQAMGEDFPMVALPTQPAMLSSVLAQIALGSPGKDEESKSQ